MGDLTENFSRAEFASPDGVPIPPEYDANLLTLARQLQKLRDMVGKPVTIHSGYRSPAYNNAIGGVPNSRHLTAQAADFSVADATFESVYCLLEHLITGGQMKQGGLGIYAAHLHYDTRGSVSRWNEGVPAPMCGPVDEPEEEEPKMEQALQNRLKVTGWFLIAAGFAVAGSTLPGWLTRTLRALLAAS